MQSPSSQVLARDSPKMKRIVLVRHAATASSEESRLHTTADETCSALGEVQAMKTAEFLMETLVENLLVSPAERAVFTAAAIAKCQSLMHNRAPRLQVMDDLKNVGVGNFSGRLASEVRSWLWHSWKPYIFCQCTLPRSCRVTPCTWMSFHSVHSPRVL